MRYLSVCSGIEACALAWHPLGWYPAAFSEIDKFPLAVLAHHYPHVLRHGDFTTIGADDYGAIDLLTGGTPCQDFSVAGLRAGITGERGKLTLEFIRLAQRKKPRWLVWENVPGVLSSDGGGAFSAFLAGLAECGYGFAYRILDAQYFGVPQRRRRVFVIGYLGDWRPAAAVLFERESLFGDITPLRQARQDAAGTITACSGRSRGVGIDSGLLAPTLPSRRTAGGGMGTDFDLEGGLITHPLRAEGFDASEDGTGRGTPLVPVTSPALKARDYKGPSSDGDGDGAPLIPVCMPINMQIATRHKALGEKTGLGYGKDGDPAFTLQSQHSHAVAFDLRGREGGAMVEGMHDTANIRAASGGSSKSYIATMMRVRRLTPRECERLQGFPDDYTLVPWRGGVSFDGPRYKALGNSAAVPVMKWLGERIQMVDVLYSGGGQ